MSEREVIDEGEWVRALDRRSFRSFDATGLDRVVAVAAHPDDETLGVGGCLQALHDRGTQIELVVATDGEAAFPHLDADGRTRLGRTRRAELADALAAQGMAGTPVHWLGLPDSGLDQRADELTELLRPLLKDADGCLVPWPEDPHPDHGTAGRAALAAAPVTAHRWSYPIWMWHWIRPDDPLIPWDRACAQALTPDLRARKDAAIAAFVSQIGDGPGGCAPILPPDVLAHFRRDTEVLFREPPRGTAPLSRFADLYAASADPWQTADSAYERRKRAVLLACLPRERYRHAFEPACGAGTLTRDLARRCDRVSAYDAVPAAVAVARAATADLPGVVIREAGLPEPPEQPADLAVLAETLYYLDDDLLDATIRATVEHLEPGGDLVVVHWRHWPAEAPRDAGDVHDRLLAHPALRAVVEHTDEHFLLHVLRRR